MKLTPFVNRRHATWIAISLLPLWSWAKIAPQTQIHVTLLGQPCLLQGPFDAKTLLEIHLIGPAQVDPNITPEDPSGSIRRTQISLEKIKKSSSLPSLLDSYRDKLGKRLQAQVSFLNSLQDWRKTHKTDFLLKTGRRYLENKDFFNFENLLKKLAKSPFETLSTREICSQLFEIYSDGIEADPEKIFHRTIKKMNVQYMCSFEEIDELGGD